MEGTTGKLKCKEKEFEMGGEKDLLHGNISYEDYDKLPEFTWEEINERVQFGVSVILFLQ